MLRLQEAIQSDIGAKSEALGKLIASNGAAHIIEKIEKNI